MNHNSSSHLFIIIFSINVNLIYYCLLYLLDLVTNTQRIDSSLMCLGKANLFKVSYLAPNMDGQGTGLAPRTMSLPHDPFHENGCPVFCLTLENEELCFRTPAKAASKVKCPLWLSLPAGSRFWVHPIHPQDDTAGTHFGFLLVLL